VPLDIVGDGSERHVDVAPAERLELLLHQPEVIVGGHPLLSNLGTGITIEQEATGVNLFAVTGA
jgi:hypothetical protein